MVFSIIIPVKSGDATIHETLSCICSSAHRSFEVIVVMDGWEHPSLSTLFSEDDRFRFVIHPKGGPAACRHHGAGLAKHDWLFFLDSDVLLHSDTLSKAAASLACTGDDGLVGAYDTKPGSPDVISRFRNLLHHYHHNRHGGISGVFWGALGVVRKSAYVDSGGFDPAFTHASVEDIELGYRLSEKGYVVCIRPDIQATHQKRWTILNMVRTDVMLRARPWTVLLGRYGQWAKNRLNTSWSERWSALFAVMTAGFCLLSLTGLHLLLPAVICAVSFLFIQLRFYRFIGRHFPVVQYPIVCSLHLVYYCSAISGWLLGRIDLLREKSI
jgi:glycosyltransferase involved in cell wall biosynthesis